MLFETFVGDAKCEEELPPPITVDFSYMTFEEIEALPEWDP